MSTYQKEKVSAPLVECKNIHKTFFLQNHKIHALRGVSLDIYTNKVVCLIGPSGSGKSTFLRCINLLEHPTAGEIVFDGQEITKQVKGRHKTRQRIGMVFQKFCTFFTFNGA